MGKYQARLCGDVILGKQDVVDVADHGIVPRVTFTDPQVCAVGLTERQARDQGVDVRVVTTGTGDVAGASTLGNGISGTSQLVVDERPPGRRGCDLHRPRRPGAAALGHRRHRRTGHPRPALARRPAFPTVSEVWLRLLEAYGL